MMINVKENRCPYITVEILGTEVKGLLDSGAAASILSDQKVLDKHNFPKTATNIQIRTADGTPHDCVSLIHIPYTFRGTTKVVPTLFVPNLAKRLILGNDFWKTFRITPALESNGILTRLETNCVGTESVDLNCVDRYFSEEGVEINLVLERTTDVIKTANPEEDISLDLPSVESPDNPDVGKIITEHELTRSERAELLKIVNHLKGDGKLGRTSVLQHKIEILEGEKPKKPPRYRWSPAIEKEMEKEIERMKELDVIEESTSDWCNPLLPVKKSSGEWRLCLDCRRINEVTKKEAYPFPDMQVILGRIEKAKYFSIIDLSKAYWQIPLAIESRDYTSFRSGKSLYRFKVMPFGLTGAPVTQTKLMNRVLGFDLEPQVFVYLDDIVVASKTLEEHFRLLRTIADRLRAANLSISVEKSKFCQKRISYLGYILSEEGLSIDSGKLDPILKYPSPKTLKEVRRLLGMIGFYKQFIPNYSTILAPITNLLKKNKSRLIWSEEAEQALNSIKGILTSPPVLANPDFSKQFVIESDASAVAAGAVLVQYQEGVRRPIAFFSRKFSATQMKYSATERECLAVILAIEKFRHFVEGTQFRVVTDAQSLKWLNQISVEGNSARLARWALKLQQHDIILEYRKGKLNVIADALSRAVEVNVLSADLDLQRLKTNIEAKAEKYKDFKIVNGKIYKYVPAGKSEDPRYEWKLVPSKADRIKILEAEHNIAHFGFYKTLRKIQEKYYWPGMSIEIKRYCRGCDTCKTSKFPNSARVPPMGRPKIADMPWQMVSVDFVGPFPRSKSGNTTLLVVTDHFSKFVMIQPMKEAKTATLVKFLESMVFLLFGVPEILISDNGPQFKSLLFEALLQKYKVSHWKNANYHPANNPTERVNRVIVAAIRSYLKGGDQKLWDSNLQEVAMAIRTAVHESTEFTPYFINHGRNYVGAGDEYARIREASTELDYDTKALNDEMKLVYEQVRTNLKKAYDKYSRYYNLRSRAANSDFKVGEIVLKKNFFLSNKAKNFNAKLADTYSPAKVVAKRGTNCYELEDLSGNRLGVFRSADLQRK